MSTVQSQNQTTSYFAQKISSRGKKIKKFNGSTTISKISERKVKRRREVKRNAKGQNVEKGRKSQKRKRKRRASQNTRRNLSGAGNVIGMHYFSLFFSLTN